LLDVSRMFGLGWRPKVSIEAGIKRASEDFTGAAAGAQVT
jgi:nucleoside-diphosphate-sugar epimerase